MAIVARVGIAAFRSLIITSTRKGFPNMLSPGNTTQEAYALGLEESRYTIARRFAPLCMRRSEIVDAVRSWRGAASDHGHASFYGAAHIRAMRAYWLGRARGYRMAA